MIYFDSGFKSCSSPACYLHENYIEFLELFKYDNGSSPEAEFTCNNIFLSTKMVPDITYSIIIIPSVLENLNWKFQNFYPNRKKIISYNNQIFNAVFTNDSYFIYGKLKQEFQPNSFNDIEVKETTAWDWKASIGAWDERNKWTKCQDPNLSNYKIETYSVHHNQKPLYGVDHFGVLGLAPKSAFWKWVQNVYFWHNSSVDLSIHYQNEDPEHDYQKSLATGKYIRPSKLTINGIYGEQEMYNFASSD